MYRKSTLEDCRAIYQLICELEQKELPYQRFSEIYYQQIQDSRYYCLVYEYNGSVVAAQLREGAHRFYLREDMHNFHYKFSKRLYGENASENILGR